MVFQKNKKAFTMLEVIFVIMIVGILAVVAIPRLSSQRDKAKASLCAVDVGNIISEISTNYVTLGYSKFQSLPISDLTNIKTGVGVDNGTGIIENGTRLVRDGFGYNCSYDKVVSFSFVLDAINKDYNLSIIPDASANLPASIVAVKLIREHYHMADGDLQFNLPLYY